MSRLITCVFTTLLVLEATGGTAAAQARGGSGARSAPNGMVRAASQAPSRTAAAPAIRASGPAGRPSAMTARSGAGRHNPVQTSSQIVVSAQRQQRHIVAVPGGFYNAFHNPYYWQPPYYPASPYFAGSYAGGYAGGYADPYYPAPSQTHSDVDLAYEVGRLTSEIEQLRREQIYAAPQPPPAPPAPEPPPAPPRAAEKPAAPITLVFRDGRQLSIQNYAIVRETLLPLGGGAPARIPLTDLDIEATQRANPGRTLLIPVPSAMTNGN